MQESCNLTIASLSTPKFCDNVKSGVHRLLFVPKMDVEAINAAIASLPESFEETNGWTF